MNRGPELVLLAGQSRPHDVREIMESRGRRVHDVENEKTLKL
jgi:hypothetical protein